MNTSGGFGRYIRVPSAWVVPLPQGLTLKESMIFGTAGFTAGMGIHFLADGVKPDAGEVLVTGATGGVGSMAVAILARLGYRVAAVSGKPEAESFLFALGAAAVIPREEVTDSSGRPLLKTRWAGVVDTVGGAILATAIRATHPWGTVTCCGNVASAELPLTVYPFILRGVRLVGIDSQSCPMVHRRVIWQKLADPWKPEPLMTMHTEATLDQLSDHIQTMLDGRIQGRTLVNLEK
jgi:putative YhdH/YhfP family quinone oxidoreductase